MALRERALAALSNIRSDRQWSDWRTVAHYLAEGRRQAMTEARDQNPDAYGVRKAFGLWLDENPEFRALDKATRAHLLWYDGKSDAVEGWRDGLARDDPDRWARMNHPSVVKRNYDADHPKPKPESDDESESKPKKDDDEGEELRKRNADLSAQIVRLRDNPFPWWSGAANDGARSMYEDRPDGRRAEGKARQLLTALAKEFRSRFPNQTAALLDELISLLRGPAESVDAAAARAVDAVAKEGRRQAKTVRRAGRLAKREAAQPKPDASK
jgi:hypothetical protein